MGTAAVVATRTAAKDDVDNIDEDDIDDNNIDDNEDEDN